MTARGKEGSSPQTRFKTYEEALDKATEMLSERFPNVDQNAVVRLADSIYALQERERFEQRERAGEIPYRS